jgi:hypothetical protein
MVLQPSTFAELVQFAKLAAESDLMPPGYKGKPANVMIAIQMGSEVGLSPMQAIQNIAVISGRPALFGDAMLALVRRDPRCIDVVETMEGEGETRRARCHVKRVHSSPVDVTFSVADARRAGLWDKAGPWKQYPDRMMQMRARGFALRDAFPDVLKGLQSAEEAQDIPTIDATAEPVAPVAALAPPPAAEKPSAEPPKRTPAQWLDALETRLAQVQSNAALDEILARKDVTSAKAAFTGLEKERLDSMIQKTTARISGPIEGLDDAPLDDAPPDGGMNT